MPVTPEQLEAGANYQYEFVVTNDPVDQVNSERPLLKWLIANRQDAVFMNGIVNEKVYKSNDANTQRFSHDDQVTFNHRDPAVLAPFQHFEYFEGFTLNATEMADNGVIITDDGGAQITNAEKLQIVNKIKTAYKAQKEGLQTTLDQDLHADGSQSAKAVPGLDLLVSLTPTVGTIGGIDASIASYWRNLISLDIDTTTAGAMSTALKQLWRQAQIFGGIRPNAIFCGAAFADAYEKELRQTVQRQVVIQGKGGTAMDGAISDLNFNGVAVMHDPTFEALDDIYAPATPWTNRCYFVSSKALHLRPNKGRWMQRHKPKSLPDRFVNYFGLTTDLGLTISQRNNMAVASIA